MQMRIRIFLLAVVLSLTAVGTAAVETDKLGSSIDTLKSYKYGNTGGVDLRWVETQVGMASKATCWAEQGHPCPPLSSWMEDT